MTPSDFTQMVQVVCSANLNGAYVLCTFRDCVIIWLLLIHLYRWTPFFFEMHYLFCYDSYLSGVAKTVIFLNANTGNTGPSINAQISLMKAPDDAE